MATIYLGDYCVGDGVADDTTGFQSALNDGAGDKQLVFGGKLIIRITSPCSMSGPGLVFDSCSYGLPGDPGVFVDPGGGWSGAALTVSGEQSDMCVAIYGSQLVNAGSLLTGARYRIATVGTTDFTAVGASQNSVGCPFEATGAGSGTGQAYLTPAADGFYFSNPILGVSRKIRAFNLYGIGVTIEQCYDCVWETISVENCGSGSDYAFQLTDGGDVCNESTIQRLQVEAAITRAISISPDSYSCIFGVIHSEQLWLPTSDVKAWALGGISCSYQNTRLTSIGSSTNAMAYLQGPWSTYSQYRAEAGIDTQLDTTGRNLTVVTPLIWGSNTGGQFHRAIGDTTSAPITVLGGCVPSDARTSSQTAITYYNTDNSNT